MATLDDLFGTSGGGKQYIKFENDGEAFLLVGRGEPYKQDQKNDKRQTVWLVQEGEGDKYKAVGQTSDFDESDYNNAFKPQDIVIPVTVTAKKDKAGSKVDSFEPFDTEWVLSRDQSEKFKDAMLEAGVPVGEGTRYALKRLSSQVKPYKYSVKILTD